MKTLLDKGDTDKATDLVLSDPSEAPVTTDEPCPLGLRWTRGLFIREGDCERARNEMTDELPEVATTHDTCHRDLKDEHVDESSEEPSKNAER